MLVTLSIENFAIIDAVQIDFEDQMTVLSGETGAGKSIIIDALGILCGGRGSTRFIREGSDKLVVEGLFRLKETAPIQATLEEVGVETDLTQESLIIRREIQRSGTNIIRINGQLANVSTLKQIGPHLSDIHGQNEHQALLNPGEHLQLLDAFGDDEHRQLLATYQTAYQQFRALRQDWFTHHQDEAIQSQRLSFIEFQAQEIEALELVEGEDEELEAQSRRLQNQQALTQSLGELNQLFSESDHSVLTQMEKAQSVLVTLADLDETYQPLGERLDALVYETQDLAATLATTTTEDALDGQSFDAIEERLMTLSQAKRKYHRTIPELMAYYDEISEEIYQITHREQYLDRLASEMFASYQQAEQAATALHQSRQHLATGLQEAILTELSDLYMANSRFEVRFKAPREDEALMETLEADQDQESVKLLQAQGYDQVEFFVATNVGETMKPLIKVASGGELSRFMLALKTVFSRNAAPKTMVFDEIDTGVSGRVAQAIAEKMVSIAKRHQVLAITHLPQVAAIAQTQLYITKAVVDGRTISAVETLDHAGRQQVVAHMISGEETTQASLELADELLAPHQREGRAGK